MCHYIQLLSLVIPVQITPVPKLKSSNVLETEMSIMILPKTKTLPPDLRKKKHEMETLISHFSESIPNLGNEHSITDGVLIGVGNQIFNLAKVDCNRLGSLFYFFIY